jgi:hypothetical protein
MHPGHKTYHLCYTIWHYFQGAVPLPQSQMVPILSFLISSGSKQKEPKCACLSEAKTSHSHRMWTEVSFWAPHFPQVRLLLIPITYKYLLKVLCPVSRPITTLDCALLKDNNRILVARLGPEINLRACLCVLQGPRHNTKSWLSTQRLILFLISCLGNPRHGSGPVNFWIEPPLARLELCRKWPGLLQKCDAETRIHSGVVMLCWTAAEKDGVFISVLSQNLQLTVSVCPCPRARARACVRACAPKMTLPPKSASFCFTYKGFLSTFPSLPIMSHGHPPYMEGC